MTNVIAVLHFDEQHAKPGIVMPPLPTISTEAIQLLKELGWTPPGHICGVLTEGGTPGLLPEITEHVRDMVTAIDAGHAPLPSTMHLVRTALAASASDGRCCDMHNVHCEQPSELCCERCTETSHDTFPIRHADGSACVLTEPNPKRMCPTCGTSWDADIAACPECQDATA